MSHHGGVIKCCIQSSDDFFGAINAAPELDIYLLQATEEWGQQDSGIRVQMQ
jgi:hypothetical protein